MGDHAPATDSTIPSLMIAAGGVSTGSGLMTLLFGMYGGQEGAGDMATQLSYVGFNALPTVSFNSTGLVALGLIFTGIALMIAGNSGAWKSTGGY